MTRLLCWIGWHCWDYDILTIANFSKVHRFCERCQQEQIWAKSLRYPRSGYVWIKTTE